MERQIRIEMTEMERYARYAQICTAGLMHNNGNETSNINDERRTEDTRMEKDWVPDIDWDKELKDKDRVFSVFCVVSTISNFFCLGPKAGNHLLMLVLIFIVFMFLLVIIFLSLSCLYLFSC